MMHANPAAAEATLLSLSQSPRPYRTCQFILENSQSPYARFQAAGAIRDAGIREWGFLETDDRRGLISFCLCFIMKHANLPEGFVIGKVASAAAQLLKRGWLDFTALEKEAFFLEVKQAVDGTHGLAVQYSGIIFLESLVSEFSPSTSTAMGLPREFHEQCLISLEHDYLKVFYNWVQHAAFHVSNKIIEADSEVPEVKVCSAALRLMLQILNWDFRGKNVVDSSKRGMDLFQGAMKQESSRRTECILVQPGPAWREMLISSGHVGWLSNFYTALRQKFSREGYWIDCPLAVFARKLLVQFCSLVGSIFPSDSGNMQKQHLLQLLAGIAQWMEPPDAVSQAIKLGKSESELLDGCRALLSIATVTTPLVFDKLLKSLRPYGTLTLLSALMREVYKDLMENQTNDETWSWVARDILLDTWTALLQQLEVSGRKDLLPSEGINAAANLFQLIVESELKAASASAFSDDDEPNYAQASIAAMDERLSSYALIARAALGSTIPFLSKLFSERIMMLHQGRGIRDPTETLEELYSLLLISGHVLADEGLGETPLVPKEIESHYTNIMEVDKHPVVALCSTIIAFAEQSLDPELRASFFSPRLMEAVVWFLARWMSTYLMIPEETGDKHSKNALIRFYGETNHGKVVLDIIIRISSSTFVSYPGEKDLQALTCYQLLHSLVKRRNIINHLVTSQTSMEFFYASLLCLFVSVIFLSLHLLFYKTKPASGGLPPGKTGWPVIGESLEFLSTGWKGHPEKFIFDRMARYSSHVFRTHLLGEPAAVLCGSAGNKFLFSNENKLVQAWWPSSVDKIFPNDNAQTSSKEEAIKMRRMLPTFFKPEALHRYVGIMDHIARRHFADGWDNKSEVVVFPLAKNYTFWLACRLFLSVEDPAQVDKFAAPFNLLASGLISIPIDLPGTPFNKGIKASAYIRKELVAIIKQRKADLADGKASPTQDILSHMLLTSNEDGKFMQESDIANKILGLLIGGHDTASSACTFIVKFLAELPQVYEGVYKEQMEIAKSKGEGELLSWEDLQKMKYSWNVACEVLRLAPPLQGAFREALADFSFNGFSIPKGWKLYWSANSTHKNKEFFPEPEKFDPSRFEGSGPAPYTFVPFGGGPRMCPGKEYARLEILVFMHHLVKRFKWEKMIPDEKIVVDPMPIPAKGLPVRLYPHTS